MSFPQNLQSQNVSFPQISLKNEAVPKNEFGAASRVLSAGRREQIIARGDQPRENRKLPNI
jgi:hypothetical protein